MHVSENKAILEGNVPNLHLDFPPWLIRRFSASVTKRFEDDKHRVEVYPWKCEEVILIKIANIN